MTDSHQPEDIAANNESSLLALVRAIKLSQGQFRLILARCNYGVLRDCLVQRLRELSPVKIREVVLPKSVKTLYTTIKAELGNEVPQALMVFDLESVSDIKVVLTSSNTIREEFSKNFPFPLVLWINDEILQNLLRVAPDLESWGTSVEFKLTTDELLDLIRHKTDELFASDSTINLEDCFELDADWKDLQRRGQVLDPDLEARLEFVRGLDDFRCDRIDQALAHYRKSLALPNLGLERQGILLINIARCYYRKAELNRAESRPFWEESRNYFQQCLDAFEQAQRPDLVAKYISQLGEVLRRLKAWDELKSLAEKALILHQTHGNSRQLAQDYGFLTEVALEQSDWKQANQLTQHALQLLSTIPNRKPTDWALYTFLLVRSQAELGEMKEAIVNLEQVRQNFNPQYDPQLYIDSLGKLRSLYFQQGDYREAFRIKQEQFQIEHQYGFRAFIGAGYLQPKRSSVNPALGEVAQQGTIAQEIAVSSREQDVKRLIERISRNDCKLTVIHGQSGVGKSSILQGGLVPALHQQTIGERDVLPVLLRVYKDWVGALRSCLDEGLSFLSRLPPQPPLLSLPFEGGLGGSLPAAILEQLRNNAENNLLTVLIFDQFEEFFFVYSDQAQRRPFYEFLRDCLDIPFAKVILSLREDYLHYLLEFNRLFDLKVINNNILDKTIRYYLGNFSPDDATIVVQNLTEKSQFPLEVELIHELVQDLAGENGEVLPIELQIVGTQLQTDKIIALEQYRQLGTKEKLVERFLEDVIEDCGSENERAARLVLYLLTNENGTRPLKTRAELVADLAAEADKLDLVLEIFVSSALVLLLPQKPEYLYQLVHDYLVDFIRQQQGNELLAELQREREQRLLTEEELKRAELKLAQVKTELEKQQVALKEVREGTRLEQEGVSALQQFEVAPLKALVSAMRSGKDLQSLVKDGRPLEQYPAISPLFALRTILDNIRERNSIQAHQGRVNSVSFSPEGKYLATASDDWTARLWNLSGRQMMKLRGHQGRVNSVNFSHDGQYIATASDDRTARLWSLFGQLLWELKGHQGSVNSVSFSPDGNLIATASSDKTARLWSLSGQRLAVLKRHLDSVNSVSFSPDGNLIATASSDKTARLWSLSGQPVLELKGHQGRVNSVSFSPDGKYIATASSDWTARLWNLSGQLLLELKGHQRRVNSVSFSPDGKYIATASDDRTAQLWNLFGHLLLELKGHQGRVNSVSFSPDGKRVSTASDDKTVRWWNLSRQRLMALKGHRGRVNSVSFSPDGKYIATASSDWTARLWNLSGQLLLELKGHQGSVNSVSFSPDCNLIATASLDKTVWLWNLSGQQLAVLKEHQDRVNSVSFSPDGKLIATASSDKTARLWSISGQLLLELKGHQGSVNSVSFSPDGKLIATASDDKTARLWNLSGQLLLELKEYQGSVNGVSFSPDGKLIATASDDRTARLWNLSGQLLLELKGHQGSVNDVNFSPDSKLIATASDDKTARLWNLSGQQLAALKGHQGSVNSVSFSLNGKLIATASSDRVIRLLPVENLDQLLVRACNWLNYYLQNPTAKISESDRHLCDDIPTQK